MDHLQTEVRNPDLANLDELTAIEFVHLADKRPQAGKKSHQMFARMMRPGSVRDQR